jgi:hypothetical protein
MKNNEWILFLAFLKVDRINRIIRIKRPSADGGASPQAIKNPKDPVNPV